MKEFTYTVTDPQGLHARPAGELVKLARSFHVMLLFPKMENRAIARRFLTLWDLVLKVEWK